MLATLLIVFREVLEAALIIGIVSAATREIAGRSRWILGGIALGVAGAVVVALFADGIANMASGLGQELFNAGVLFAAVIMLAWHAIWMSQHGRELAAHATSVGRAVQEGTAPVVALMVIVLLAVLREGSEVVLFLYGMVAAGGTESSQMLAGGLLGLALGSAMGFGMYFGLLRIPLRHFFTVTNWMILLLAAGLASQGARYLVQADLLPSLGEQVWDTSHILSEHSLLGQMLHTLIGYDATPSGMQIVFYVATATLIAMGMLKWNAVRPKPALSH
ncbi:MAG TPA: FTR1 family protein [Steroidobacteraceae bacterium]|nr:FTR1 family protein [Steroidobacteraceae bacterium]